MEKDIPSHPDCRPPHPKPTPIPTRKSSPNRHRSLQAFLDERVQRYNQPSFLEKDPVCIPHRFTHRADIEIAGLFAAVFAWGNRKTIIQKSRELLQRMDNAPFDFITRHQDSDLKNLLGFRHRTFQDTDLLYFVSFLHHHYIGRLQPTPLPSNNAHTASLESAFATWMDPDDPDTTRALAGFHRYFFSLPEHPERTRKHLPCPERGSSCKRLNMFLRWMVRKDEQGVDFGLWNRIRPAQLVCPIDVHVARTARRFGLLQRTQTDWQAALELTHALRQMSPDDPVRYDYALFGLGAEEGY